MTLCDVNDPGCDVIASITTPEVCALMVYFCVIFILSLLFNGTICVVFYKRPNLLTVSNSLVLNLTCCELGISILIMPFWAMSLVNRKWAMSDIWCRVQAYLLTMLVVALQFSLLIIAVDRNCAIINSLRYPYIFSPRLGNILIAITWISGLVISMPPLFTHGEFGYQSHQYVCSVTWESQSRYGVFIIFAAFILPFIVQTVCYLSIFKAAIKHTKSANRVYPSLASTSTAHDISVITSVEVDVTAHVPAPRSRRMGCKAVKTILIIYGSYLVSWLCYIVTGLMKSFGTNTHYSFDMAGICLVFLSCAVNPMIYGFMNRVTRNEIWKYFSRANQRITGAETVHLESEDYFSSTLTTNFSSGRHNSGSFVPSPRGRSNSIKTTIPRPGEMMTIQEVSETEDDNSKSSIIVNEQNKSSKQLTLSRLGQYNSYEIVLKPSKLKSLKRWKSNGDLIRTFPPSFRKKPASPIHTLMRKVGHSKTRNNKILTRSQSFSPGVSRTGFMNERRKSVNIQCVKNPLTYGDIL